MPQACDPIFKGSLPFIITGIEHQLQINEIFKSSIESNSRI